MAFCKRSGRSDIMLLFLLTLPLLFYTLLMLFCLLMMLFCTLLMLFCTLLMLFYNNNALGGNGVFVERRTLWG